MSISSIRLLRIKGLKKINTALHSNTADSREGETLPTTRSQPHHSVSVNLLFSGNILMLGSAPH